jgi:hypothetical protein
VGDESYRSMKGWQLRAALETNTRALAGLADEEGISEAKRDMMSASLGKLIRELNREVARRQAVAAAKVAGIVFGIMFWLGGSILVGVFVDDATGAVLFWIGLVIALVLALVFWAVSVTRDSRKRY